MLQTNKDTIKQLQHHFYHSNAVDLAQEFEQLDNSQKMLWLGTMNKSLLADTFSLLNPATKEEVITLLTDAEMVRLIAQLESDELVDTIRELPANIVKRLIAHLQADRRQVINQLLNYPDESVGSVMTVDYLALKRDTSLADALAAVQASSLEADNLEEIWVIDRDRTLVGYLNLADLLRRSADVIGDVMTPVTIKVSATDDQETAAKLAQRYFLSALPVVDSENRLLGSIQAESLLTILQDEFHEDMSHLQGIMDADSSEHYLQEAPLQIAKNRVVWLIICLVTATITSFIIQRYEAVLASSVALVAFIPMLMDSGGNAGSQSSTTLIRAISVGEVTLKDTLQVIFREALIGLYVGLALVAVNALRILLFDNQSAAIIITISITLLLTIVLSKIMGALLPLFATKLRIDPTVMAGPIITTIVDTASLIVFFEVAKIFLQLPEL